MTQKGGSVKSKAKEVVKFAKDHKLISRGLSKIPHPAAQAGAAIARQFGYGQHGGNFLGSLLGSLGQAVGTVAYGVGSGIGAAGRGIIHGRGRAVIPVAKISGGSGGAKLVVPVAKI